MFRHPIKWAGFAAGLALLLAPTAAYASGDGPTPPPGKCVVTKDVVACSGPSGVRSQFIAPATLPGRTLRLAQWVGVSIPFTTGTVHAGRGDQLVIPWIADNHQELVLSAGATSGTISTVLSFVAGPGRVAAYTLPAGVGGGMLSPVIMTNDSAEAVVLPTTGGPVDTVDAVTVACATFCGPPGHLQAPITHRYPPIPPVRLSRGVTWLAAATPFGPAGTPVTASANRPVLAAGSKTAHGPWATAATAQPGQYLWALQPANPVGLTIRTRTTFPLNNSYGGLGNDPVRTQYPGATVPLGVGQLAIQAKPAQAGTWAPVTITAHYDGHRWARARIRVTAYGDPPQLKQAYVTTNAQGVATDQVRSTHPGPVTIKAVAIGPVTAAARTRMTIRPFPWWLLLLLLLLLLALLYEWSRRNRQNRRARQRAALDSSPQGV